MSTLVEQLQETLADATRRLAAAEDVDAVEALRVEFVGRSGRVPALMKEMRNVPAEEKPTVGKTANQVKQGIQSAIDEAKERVREAAESAAGGIDVTMPGRRRERGHKHPVNRVMDDTVDIFRRLGFIAADGPDLETEYYNFDALNTPADHPSRDIQDTFYLPDGRLLRTQTSPVQIRVMEKQSPPVRILCPGRCFRRDTPDATHSMNFHQIEGLYVDRNVSLADLKAVLSAFAHELLGPDVKVRFRPHFFPFTEPSIEYDFSCIMCKGEGCRICKNSGWLEISGAGMVDPAVFDAVGYDPEEWTGFAFGMGIERIAMIRYALTDIRMLYENDMRFLGQF
ncbi:MAG: phenylalanine--tRNA ligase subunit alpha [Lentisphaeria bacterium]